MTRLVPAARTRRHLGTAAVLVGLVGLAAGCAPGDDGRTQPAPVQADPPAPASSARSVTTLAKVEGWRGGLEPGDASAVLEVAYDRDTAQVLWEENVPGGLPTGTAPAVDPAVYGSIDDVDFPGQVVALYSSGESGSCPALVDDVATALGTVSITTQARGTTCTDDYWAFSTVLVLDAVDLPPEHTLDGTPATVRDRDLDRDIEVAATVSTYPAP